MSLKTAPRSVGHWKVLAGQPALLNNTAGAVGSGNIDAMLSVARQTSRASSDGRAMLMVVGGDVWVEI
jgi:hypothetical protein